MHCNNVSLKLTGSFEQASKGKLAVFLSFESHIAFHLAIKFIVNVQNTYVAGCSAIHFSCVATSYN